MIVWIDAQFSPALATWLTNTFSVDAVAIRDLKLRQAKDKEIFEAARVNNAVVMTKDSDSSCCWIDSAHHLKLFGSRAEILRTHD
jgi:predicted nuclease of predicted toxin-antitoxin system